MNKKKKRATGRKKPPAPTTRPPSDTVQIPALTMVPLTAKDARFVAEYLIDYNGARAARAIGSTAKNTSEAASEYLNKPEVAAAIRAHQAVYLATAAVSRERLDEECDRLALVNIRDYFDPVTLGAKHPLMLSDAQGACLAGFEVIKRNLFPDDGHTDTIWKFKLWDKPKAIELAMKRRGMLIEKVEVKDTTVDARVARLVAARKRVAKVNK